MNEKEYDIIVIGGGHAGIEASCVAAKLKKSVCLITLSVDKIGFMHCNPSVGGSAKGIVVREIDALGGVMGKAADSTALQFKLLNSSSGPAIQALRVQSDKMFYASWMKDYVLSQNGIDTIEGSVERIIINNNQIEGVQLSDKRTIFAKAVILTTGTYLQPLTYKGSEVKNEGPDGEKKVVNGISAQLREMGFEMKRFKTGTPPRILKDSIDYSVCKLELGSNLPLRFSRSSDLNSIIRYENQLPCYLIHTNESTHEIIRKNLHLSPICYKEDIGRGPRYCPSIEDKILRFPDKERHQVFLEPESKNLDTIYVQGVSTSLPIEVQDQLIRSLPGLGNCIVKKWGYAIEYDVINSNQLKPTLECKIIKNFFTAGQINGTSGYEEAAAQGIIAGINAVKSIDNLNPFIIPRDKAYIGVLIDDLVTKENNEPYRLLTSRAEFRLLLRHDNVYSRLTPLSYENHLISKEEWENHLKIDNQKKSLIEKIKNFYFSREETFSIFPKVKSDEFKNFEKISALNLLKNQKVTLQELSKFFNEINNLDWEGRREIEIELIYEDYVKKQFEEVEKLNKYENKKIPKDIDYYQIHNLAAEAKEKLNRIRPLSLGQAARISGINPTDIQVLNKFIRSSVNC